MAKRWYDKEEDIIGIQLQRGAYWKSIELQDGVIMDVSKKGRILGIEIPHAKKVFSQVTKQMLQAVAKS